MPALLLIDAHVHLHPGEDLGLCLDAAAANFARAQQALSWTGPATGVLMLAERAGVNRFAEMARADSLGPWRVRPSPEDLSLQARKPDAMPLLIVAGRQAATTERLEVLALGTLAALSDHQSLAETLAAARATGGLAVLPYGVGKWTGQRGRLVRQLIEQADEPPILGDNANRLASVPTPALLRNAHRRGLTVLPGSDPLPLPGHRQRIGSYGLALEHDLDPAAPARHLRTLLAAPPRASRRFGRLTPPGRFLTTQLALRMSKRP